jgi:hypothetical protein
MWQTQAACFARFAILAIVARLQPVAFWIDSATWTG